MFQTTVSESQLEQVVRWIKAGSTPQSVAVRSMIILEAHWGQSARMIGKTLKVSKPTIRLWKRRFMEGGLQALTTIAPGPGRKRQISRQKVTALVQATQHTKPLEVQQWLKKRPRFQLHFISTSASKTNLVERWSRELTEKEIRRGAFGSVGDLESAIHPAASSLSGFSSMTW